MDSILQYHKTEINCFSLIPEQSKGYDMSLVLKEKELVSCDCSGDIVFWKKEEVECAFSPFLQDLWKSYQVLSVGEPIGDTCELLFYSRDCLLPCSGRSQ